MSKPERRRLSRIVHDHKGNARVEWYDAPAGEDRLALEIATTGKHRIDTGSLSIKTEDTFNPYMRVPDSDRKRGSGTRTDLRKLSAWIKMMRELEEARNRNENESEGESEDEDEDEDD